MAAIQSPPTSEGAPVLPANEARRLLSFATIQSQPPSQSPLWEKGYNDKILHNYSTLDKWKSYIEDNPRRLAVRRAHADFFRVRFGLSVAGQDYAAIGNRFLLQHPERVQVRLSRSLTDEQIRQATDHYLALARADGRFLILAPWEHHNERIPLTRTMCLTLNTMTEQICNL